MTNLTKLTKSESEPAWAGASSDIQLYDGKSFLSMSTDVRPGFIFLELANRTRVSLCWVSYTITPINGDPLICSRGAPISISPSLRADVPIAYTAASACECSILVTFRCAAQGVTGSRIHICQTRAYLIPTPEDAFRSLPTWRAIKPKFTRREVSLTAMANLSPVGAIEGMGVFVGGKFVPLLDNARSGEISASWGCIDPLLMVTFASEGSSLVVYGLDTAILDRIVAESSTWSKGGQSREVSMFELGVACITLRDGLQLLAKTEHMRPVGRQVAQLAGNLGLPVPSLAALLDVLAARESLADLIESEREVYKRALAEIETQVVGRPS